MLCGHLGDMDQTLDGIAKSNECTKRNDLGDLAIDDGADRVRLDELDPRILSGLLQAEADALTLEIDVENLDLNLVANLDDLGRMVDMVPRKLGDMDQTVDTAKVDKRAEVDDAGDGALEAHALGKLGENLSTLVATALLEENATGQNNVVAVAIHLDDASLNLGAEVHIKILYTAKVNKGGRQKSAKTDVENKAALDNLDNLASNDLASLELLLDADPGALVLSALLGQDQTAILVLLLENESLELVADRDNLARICVLADGQLTRGNDTLALEADVHQDLVMLNLDNRTVDKVALVKIGQGAIDHGIHLIVVDVSEIDNRSVLDFGQNGPLSKMGDPSP